MNYVFGKLIDGLFGKFNIVDIYISLFWVFVFIAIFTVYLRLVDRQKVIARMLGAKDSESLSASPILQVNLGICLNPLEPKSTMSTFHFHGEEG